MVAKDSFFIDDRDAETLVDDIATSARSMLKKSKRSTIDRRSVEWEQARVNASFGNNMMGLTGEYRTASGGSHIFEVEGSQLFKLFLGLRSTVEATDETQIASLRVAFTPSDVSLFHSDSDDYGYSPDDWPSHSD